MAETKEIFAFVLMPFSSDFDDAYKVGIKETAQALKIRAERVDEQIYNETILERIYQQIESADIIIADMTGQNPNVFYEVGYAHAKEKPCILLTRSAEDIPFDLKHHRHIVYRNGSVIKLREELEKELVWAKQEIEKIRTSQIKINSNAWGLLEKSKYFDHADVTLKLDLENSGKRGSPEIEGAYIYTGLGWEFRQDGKKLPSKKSDITFLHSCAKITKRSMDTN